MKKKVIYYENQKRCEKYVDYIPFRYIIAIILTLLETLIMIGIVILLCIFIPFFYIAVLATQMFCTIHIIVSNDNPDYKLPWLLFVLILPIIGFMLYFIFYSRKLSARYTKKLKKIDSSGYVKSDEMEFKMLEEENEYAYSQASMLAKISGGHLFTNTKQLYFKSGEEMHKRLIEDLKKAQSFIFMEYFIIEEGVFWNSLLEILKEKAQNNVDVRIVYDDIGCMMTLPGNYAKQLKKYKIKATPFSILKGNANNEFNNRSHRKITVIDGLIGYTGGVNLADEYINVKQKHGHWKDIGIRLEGQGVYELTRLFLADYALNYKNGEKEDYEVFYPEAFPNYTAGYLIPFGDGPKPIYKHRIGKIIIQSMLNLATKEVYITTPYLIIDNELCMSIENAALRGVNVKIVVPHIPDKKMVFMMTKSFYPRLIEAGVEIYEYEPGFIHAKSYIVDAKYAMIGTINLDYRSLVHHFENGIWMYNCPAIVDMHKDVSEVIGKSIRVTIGKKSLIFFEDVLVR